VKLDEKTALNFQPIHYHSQFLILTQFSEDSSKELYIVQEFPELSASGVSTSLLATLF